MPACVLRIACCVKWQADIPIYLTQRAIRNTQDGSRTTLAEAHRMLSDVYHWFTEGFETKDLLEAQALLAALA